MEKISLLTLRRDLTRIRKRLKDGESFLVTERGTVIAFLQPVIHDQVDVARREKE